MADLTFDIVVPLNGREMRFAAALPLAGVTVVTGPSGAGKTTLLRALAGLAPAIGPVTRGDTRLDGLPPHRRGIGYVFQEPRLFPHLTAAGNLAYGARRRGADPARVAGIAAALDLGPLMDRRPATLSGGEARRVALGRALASAPDLLLLDEPLSGLDAARKAEIFPYLARALAQADLPTLLVTHAEDETLALADRVLAIADGGVAGLRPGPPRLRATVTACDGGQATLAVGTLSLTLPLDAAPGSAWALVLPPDGAILAAADPGPCDALAVLPACVAGVEGDRLVLEIGGQTVAWARGAFSPAPGTACTLLVRRLTLRPAPGAA